MPEFRKIRSRSGWVDVMFVTKFGIESSWVMSIGTAWTLSWPCLWTSSARFSLRRPTAMTKMLFSMRRSARARPMPVVDCS